MCLSMAQAMAKPMAKTMTVRGKPSPSALRTPFQRTNILLILGSVLFCALLQSQRIPGMVLLETAPNWLLIWVVTWSVKRSPLEGLLAGIALGLIQDGLTTAQPTHAISLGIAGFLTSGIDRQRIIAEDFVSALLLVFVMAMMVEIIFAGQLALGGAWIPFELWPHLQRVALSSAVISSLWTPLIYVPLNYWWDRFNRLMER
jgi:rod shape-determining protein MreD